MAHLFWSPEGDVCPIYRSIVQPVRVSRACGMASSAMASSASGEITRMAPTGFDHHVGHFRPLRIMGVAPKPPCSQRVRCFSLGYELLGWPTPGSRPKKPQKTLKEKRQVKR